MIATPSPIRHHPHARRPCRLQEGPSRTRAVSITPSPLSISMAWGHDSSECRVWQRGGGGGRLSLLRVGGPLTGAGRGASTWSGCSVRIRLWPCLPRDCHRLLSILPTRGASVECPANWCSSLDPTSAGHFSCPGSTGLGVHAGQGPLPPRAAIVAGPIWPHGPGGGGGNSSKYLQFCTEPFVLGISWRVCVWMCTAVGTEGHSSRCGGMQQHCRHLRSLAGLFTGR